MVETTIVDSNEMSSPSRNSRDNRGATANATKQHQQIVPIPNRKKQKAGSRAKHRLRSIYRDTLAMHEVLRQSQTQEKSLATHALSQWKIIANERCGSWYASSTAPQNNTCSSCYFKSTDGHFDVWDFSLKRLNLPLLEQTLVLDGGCILMDSSVRKLLPDSFSKTIPIWAAVLNNFVLHYRKNQSERIPDNYKNWDTHVYTPREIVSKEEHDTIASLIQERTETLFRSGAIVNPKKLVETLTKPIRVVWMNHEGKLYASHGDQEKSTLGNDTLDRFLENHFVIVCWNPSQYIRKPNTSAGEETTLSNSEVIALKKHQTEWIADHCNDHDTDQGGYYYTPGAADDHECWALKLTPALFWKNQEALLDPEVDDDGIDALIDSLVTQEHNEQTEREKQHRIHNGENCDTAAMAMVYSYSNKIGELNLWVGSRRASRPPECWSGFDAILNVTNQEYENMDEKNDFYLQLPVQEGKRDRTQLEKWMPVGLAFLIHHLQANRRVLVHCAQGKDRSVAVALVFVTVACPLQFPLRYKPEFTSRPWDLSTIETEELHEPNNSYLSSGLPEATVRRLLEADGREAFLSWLHQQNDKTNSQPLEYFADKEGVRIALHLIKQDREVAEPTRATMQKINRFLMSSSIYRR